MHIPKEMNDPAEPDFSSSPVSPARPQAVYQAAAKKDLPPIVSILVPFFNTGAIFKETAAALQNQTFQQSEIIFIDDGSTDPEAIALLGGLQDLALRSMLLTHSENRGLSAARNTGIRSARGPFIFLQDSDDLIEPTAIEKFLWFLLAHPELGFVSSYEVGFGDTTYLNRNGFHDERHYLIENRTCPLTMIRKTVFDHAGGFDEALRQGLEDWDFWLRCAENGIWGGTVPEYLKWYRRAFSQFGRWADWDHGERQALFLKKLVEKYPKVYSGYFPEPAWQKLPFELTPINPLKLPSPVLILAEKISGVDNQAIEALRQSLNGRHLCIAVLDSVERASEEHLLRLTSDMFVLPRFLPKEFTAEFLRYLDQSRSFAGILLSSARESLRFSALLGERAGPQNVRIFPAERPLAGLGQLL